MPDYAQVIDGKVSNLIVMDSHSQEAEKWLEDNLGGDWVPCNLDDVPGSFASVGSDYDSETGWFIPEPEFGSWNFNRDSWAWEPPVEMPNDGIKYLWDEEKLSWVEPPALLDS